MFEACLAPTEPQLSHGCQEPFPTGDTLWLRKGSNIAPQEVQYSVQSLILRQWQFEPSALNCTCCRGHPTHSGFTGSKDTVGSNWLQKLCFPNLKAMISTFYWPAELRAAWSMSTAELRAANRLCKAVTVFDCVWLQVIPVTSLEGRQTRQEILSKFVKENSVPTFPPTQLKLCTSLTDPFPKAGRFYHCWLLVLFNFSVCFFIWPILSPILILFDRLDSNAENEAGNHFWKYLLKPNLDPSAALLAYQCDLAITPARDPKQRRG